MIKIPSRDLISEVPDIQSVSLPGNWFSNINFDRSVFASLYDWMVEEGSVPREYANRLHDLTYVGELTHKKLMAAEEKRLKKNRKDLKEGDLRNALAWADLGSGPMSEIYNCVIGGNCILVIPEASKTRLYECVPKIIQRERDKVVAKIRNGAAGATFYQWLVSQIKRPDDIGDLAQEAKSDKAFPRDAEYCEEIELYRGTQAPLLDAHQQAWVEYFLQYPERLRHYAWCRECNKKIDIKEASVVVCDESWDIGVLCQPCIPNVFHRSPLFEIHLFKITQEKLKAFALSHGLEGYEIASFIERLKIWGIFPLNETGFIYFIQSEDTRKVKIGYSVAPAERLRNLQTGHPCPLKLLKTIPGDMKFERALHRKFLEFRVQGEWFEPHPDIIEYISKV